MTVAKPIRCASSTDERRAHAQRLMPHPAHTTDHHDAVIEESENAAFDHTERPRHLWPTSRKGPGPLGPKAWGPEAESAQGTGHDTNASTIQRHQHNGRFHSNDNKWLRATREAQRRMQESNPDRYKSAGV